MDQPHPLSLMRLSEYLYICLSLICVSVSLYIESFVWLFSGFLFSGQSADLIRHVLKDRDLEDGRQIRVFFVGLADQLAFI